MDRTTAQAIQDGTYPFTSTTKTVDGVVWTREWEKWNCTNIYGVITVHDRDETIGHMEPSIVALYNNKGKYTSESLSHGNDIGPDGIGAIEDWSVEGKLRHAMKKARRLFGPVATQWETFT